MGEEPPEGPRGAREESFTAAVVSKVSAPAARCHLRARRASSVLGDRGVPGSASRSRVPCDASAGAGGLRGLREGRPRCPSPPLSRCPVSRQMKRALVLGASALLILALNQNALREVRASRRGSPRPPPRAPPTPLAFLPAAAGRFAAPRQARHRHPVLGQRHQAAGSAAAVRAGRAPRPLPGGPARPGSASRGLPWGVSHTASRSLGWGGQAPAGAVTRVSREGDSPSAGPHGGAAQHRGGCGHGGATGLIPLCPRD